MSEQQSWICLVCGYVHQGTAPPETCPVCGAPASEFEEHEAQAFEAKSSSSQWRCLVCGYVHEGTSPPAECPVCGASADEFESWAPKGSPPSGRGAKGTIVVVGAGIAGVSAAQAAREQSPEATITLISKEKELPYYRLNLTRYLAGEIDDDALPLHPRRWYEEQGINLMLGAEVTAIDAAEHSLEIKDQTQASFDKLVLACGAHPFIPPIDGADKEGVIAVRTMADVRNLLARIKSGTPCVCIGGGILGLETAGALSRRGAEVALLESYGYLLPRQLNRAAAEILEAHVESLGIRICRDAKSEAITGEAPELSVTLATGESLSAAVVTITTGIRANTHLARKAGLSVNDGIVVDTWLTTSHPDIYAVGDAAEFDGGIGGLWEPARYQGTIAGRNAAGESMAFGGLPRMNTLKVLGLNMFSIGVIQPEDGSYQEFVEKKDDLYQRLLFHDNKLAGAILLGDTSAASGISRAMRESTDFRELLAKHPTAQEVLQALTEK